MAQVFADNTPSAKHEITSLPGWKGPLPSRMFSGYIDAGTPPSGTGKMYFHYWLVESESDPMNDPVVFWYNGGPGASSLWGLLQELGPLKLNEDSYDESYNITGVPSPQRNIYSWSRAATIVAIDSPPPMGLSFCTEVGPSGNGTTCGPWKDTDVFEANHAAYVSFFNDLFPELKENGFYLSGESYAGIYVPGFANQLLEKPIPGLNFKGLAVGDGWTGCPQVAGKSKIDWCIDLDNVGLFQYPNANQGPWYDVEFFHGHYQYSEELYRAIRSNCSEQMLRTASTAELSESCRGLIEQMAEEVGGWFPYDLENDCVSLESTNAQDHHGINRALRHRRAVFKRIRDGISPQIPTGPGHAGGGKACSGNAMAEWLMLNQTLEAIGAPQNSNFVNLDNGHGFSYTSNQPSVTPIYKQAVESGLRVLLYEGDTDACGLQTAPVEDVFVPFFAEIGLNKTQRWRPFTVDGKQQMGGYTIEWNDGLARFVSIRGAGHLVPLNKPVAALIMLECFLQDTKLPKYVQPASRLSLP